MTDQHGIGLLLMSMGIMLKMVPENKIPTWRTIRYAITNSKHSKSNSKSETEGSLEEDEEKRALV